MIVVIGNEPRGVSLRDLDDTVYYKQEKIYSEDQYNKSSDLRNALKKGSLSRIEEKKEPDANYRIPASAEVLEVPKVASMDNSALGLLLEKISSLETVLRTQVEKEKSSDEKEALKNIQERLERLEGKLATVPSETPDKGLSEALKGIAAKLDESQKSSDPSDKLNSILNRLERRLDGDTSADDQEIQGEIYVPTVTVEDANAHIKLDVRTIENSDSVNESLKALQALKKNNQ